VLVNFALPEEIRGDQLSQVPGSPRACHHRKKATFKKGKAAGWGPGGSRTSAIVSGGWECDRRR
jgi:hypothetical protein